MRANLERGLSAAEAARLALSETHAGATPLFAEAAAELDAALSIFDEASAQAVLDRLFGSLSIDAALREVVVPFLHELGERWQRGEVSIAQEHFASNVVRGRLMAMARGWGRGSGPLAVLACAEDEQHDIPLLLFGLLLRTYGWRVGYLGADTPLPSLVQAVRELHPSAVVVSGTAAGVLDRQSAGLQEVALHAPLYVAGAAASEELARQAHGVYLDGDMFAAADTLANGIADLVRCRPALNPCRSSLPTGPRCEPIVPPTEERSGGRFAEVGDLQGLSCAREDSNLRPAD